MTSTVSTVVTTANIEGSLGHQQAQEAYDIARRGSHFLGTQEMQRREASTFVPKGWGTIQSTNRRQGRGRCALHWQVTRFTKLSWGNPLLHLSNLFPSGDRFYVWGKFRDRVTGRKFTVVVIHFGPHYDDAQGGISDMPRGKLATRSITVLISFVRLSSLGQVFVMGDFNIDARKDLVHNDTTDLIERFRSAGLRSVSATLKQAIPTHAHSSYDQVFYRLTKGAGQVVSQWTRKNGPGDHLAYSAEFAITKRAAPLT